MAMPGTPSVDLRNRALCRAGVAAPIGITSLRNRRFLTGSTGFYRYFFGGFTTGGKAPDST